MQLIVKVVVLVASMHHLGEPLSFEVELELGTRVIIYKNIPVHEAPILFKQQIVKFNSTIETKNRINKVEKIVIHVIKTIEANPNQPEVK